MDSTLPFLFAVALAGGIWGLLITLRAPTLHVTLAILLVAYCFGPEFGTVDLGPINLSLDRLAILFLLCFGVLKRVLTDQPRIVPERTDMVLALFVLILLTSALLHPWVPRLHRPAPWYRWISSFAAPAIMYGVMRVRQRSPADVWKICAFFAIVGVYLAITAMGEVYRTS
jgi:hypothetical protein